jgi:hypothetical protein
MSYCGSTRTRTPACDSSTSTAGAQIAGKKMLSQLTYLILEQNRR